MMTATPGSGWARMRMDALTINAVDAAGRAVMSEVTREHLAGLKLANEKTGFSIPVLAQLIAQASAAPEQEPVAFSTEQGVLFWKDKGPMDWVGKPSLLYTHADPSEVERLRAELELWKLRSGGNLYAAQVMEELADGQETELVALGQKLAEAQALLARVVNSGALTCDQYTELEADICAAVDVVAVLKRMDFEEHLAKCAEEVAAMPTYKRECLKSPAALSAAAQPAEVKS